MIGKFLAHVIPITGQTPYIIHQTMEVAFIEKCFRLGPSWTTGDTLGKWSESQIWYKGLWDCTICFGLRFRRFRLEFQTNLIESKAKLSKLQNFYQGSKLCGRRNGQSTISTVGSSALFLTGMLRNDIGHGKATPFFAARSCRPRSKVDLGWFMEENWIWETMILPECIWHFTQISFDIICIRVTYYMYT